MAAGTFGVMPGPMMASFDLFDITVRGKGGHAAFPHTTIDPLLAGARLVDALQGIVRVFKAEVRDAVEAEMKRMCEGLAIAHGVQIDLRYERRYPPTVNSAPEAAIAREAAERRVGPNRVTVDGQALMAAEDLAFMLEARPGAYVWIGNGVGAQGGCMVHNPGYDFNDEILPLGSAYWVSLVQTALGASAR